MTETSSLLPREVTVLVPHVELNSAGWWEKALSRLVLSTVWLGDGNQDIASIQKTLQTTFGLKISLEKLKSVLSSLEKEDCLVEVSDAIFRIPEKVRKTFDQEIEEAEKQFE